MMEEEGDLLPVSAFPPDGTFPHRHGAMGEAEHRPGDPHLGSRDLHRLRQVCIGLSPRVDPDEEFEPEAVDPRPRVSSTRSGRIGSIRVAG